MRETARELRGELTGLQELKRGGLGNWLWLVFFSLRNWFVGWAFFLPSFFLSLIGMLTSAAIFYFMGQMVAKGADPYISQYGISYGSYIITGIMFNLMLGETLDAYHNAFTRGYWMGQFDMYIQHPGGVSSLLTGEVIAKYSVALVNTFVYFATGTWLFGVSVNVSNLFDTAVILILAIFSLTGLGLAGASTFTLMNAKREEPNPVKLITDFGVILLAGVYFPPAVLPAWLQNVGYWLPQTHALNAARLCLSGKATLSSPALAGDIFFLLIFGAVTLPLGALAFRLAIRKAERDGSLTRWS